MPENSFYSYKKALTPKQRVLKKYQYARCFNRGYDRRRRCYWWQVWNPPEDGGSLLGMAKSATGAWAEAARRKEIK